MTSTLTALANLEHGNGRHPLGAGDIVADVACPRLLFRLSGIVSPFSPSNARASPHEREIRPARNSQLHTIPFPVAGDGRPLASEASSFKYPPRPPRLDKTGNGIKALSPMHTAAIIVACFAGQFACAFLLVAIVLLATPSKDRFDLKVPLPLGLILPLLFLDLILDGGLSFLAQAAINWPKERQARRFTYLGTACLALTVIALAAVKISS